MNHAAAKDPTSPPREEPCPNSNLTKLSRRALLKASAGASALGILGAPAIVSRANAQSKFDWKRFAGEKIDVMMVKNPRADLLQKDEKEFFDLTGITVSSEQIPEQQQRQKAMIEFSSGRPTFDVTFLALHVQKRLSYKGKWTDDLRPMIANPELTSPDFDLADFGKAGLDLRDAGRRRDEHASSFRRLLDALLQQGNLPEEGRRLSDLDGRHRRGGCQAERSGRAA